MVRRSRALAIGALLLAIACSSSDEEQTQTLLRVSWIFEAGDCASNGIDGVRVEWGPSGAARTRLDLACAAGGAALGPIELGRPYDVVASALDAGAVVRALGGAQVTLTSGRPPTLDTHLVLYPALGRVLVSWSTADGAGCPGAIIVPYRVTLWEAPAVPGGALTRSVEDMQVDCFADGATFEHVHPGPYVVEVTAISTSPRITGSAPVTVGPGDERAVHVDL
jgi:hypothetical protein